MSLELRPFGKDQAADAAHMAISAWVDNPFRKILFPDGMGQASYDRIHKGVLESADDPDSHLLQIYDTETDKMVAYAVWCWTKAVSDDEWESKLEKRYEAYPDARQDVLRPFLANETEAKRKLMGNSRWWELQSLSVSLDHQRKGLGGRLVTWGTDELERRQLPGFIVATQDGYGLYIKHGFSPKETWEVDLEKWGGKGEYMNAAMIRYPKKEKQEAS